MAELFNGKDLIAQQQKVNASSTAAAQSYGVTGGQGVASAGNVIAGAMTAGIEAVSKLTHEESMALTQAKIAGDNQDYQLQEKINTQIETNRK